MALMRPDPTFYPSPRTAIQAPAERIAYVATLNYGTNERPDALLWSIWIPGRRRTAR
jgi:selenium-binding protein 1